MQEHELVLIGPADAGFAGGDPVEHNVAQAICDSSRKTRPVYPQTLCYLVARLSLRKKPMPQEKLK